MKVLIYSTHGFDKPFIESTNANKHALTFTEKTLSISTVDLAKGFDAISLFTSDKASEEVIIQLKKFGVKFISLRSVGYDHVDLKKAKELDIKVANVPAYSPNAIAEHAVALLMAINRKIIRSQELIHRNDFRLDELVGFDLFEKTIGVVGTGKIGSSFIRIMNGFGCKILAYDISINDELVKKYNVEYTSLEYLCKNSEVVALNCPLNVSTKYLFNKSLFSKFKKGSIFINTARGGIVNTIDLLEALDSGIISAAGLDVYEYEKPIFFQNHTESTLNDDLFQKLVSHKKVLLTGHQAFLTKEALSGIASTVIENLNEWEKNGVCINEVS